jgi:hypothetical protein
MQPQWTGTGTARHYAWIYARVRKNFETADAGLAKNKTYSARDSRGKRVKRRQGQFTVFRTISDSPEQVGRRLWFSAGIRPVNLREKLGEAINEAIRNMIAGRNPDGSERGSA